MRDLTEEEREKYNRSLDKLYKPVNFPLEIRNTKMQFVAYGLDIVGYLIIEVEESTIIKGHNKVLKILEDSNTDYDTVEPFNKEFIERMNWGTR